MDKEENKNIFVRLNDVLGLFKNRKKTRLNKEERDKIINIISSNIPHYGPLTNPVLRKDDAVSRIDGGTYNSQNKIKVETLGEKERKLLLTALDFDINNLKCQYCKERVSYKDCCIMPPIKTKKKATILCNSPMCIIWYLEESGVELE